MPDPTPTIDDAAPAWEEIAGHPAFQKAAPAGKQFLQDLYWNQAVLPKYSGQDKSLPDLRGLDPRSMETLKRSFFYNHQPTAVPPQTAVPAAPSMGERMEQGAISSLPGAQTAQAFSNPSSQGIDKAAAISGDIGNLAGYGALIAAAPETGGLSLAAPLLAHTAIGAGLGAAGGALQPVAKAAGDLGQKAGDFLTQGISEDDPSMAMQILKRTPGMVGSAAGEALPSIIAQALGAGVGRKIVGPAMRPVPQGQEAGALLGNAQKNFNLPGSAVPAELPKGPMTIGNLMGILGKGRQELGNNVAQAQAPAFSAANAVVGPEQIQGGLNQAIQGVIAKKTGGAGLETARNPEALRTLQGVAKEAVPGVTDMESANNVQKRVADLAAQAQNKASVTHPQAATLGAASQAMQQAINKFIPEQPLADLQAANKQFSTFANLHDLVSKASDSAKNFSPDKFVAAWNKMTPETKAAKFTPEQVQAVDGMVKQHSTGPLAAFGHKVQQVTAGAVAHTLFGGAGTQLGKSMLTPATQSPRFNAPNTGALHTALAPVASAMGTVPPIARALGATQQAQQNANQVQLPQLIRQAMNR